MISGSNTGLSDLMTQRAAQLHRLAVHQAMQRLAKNAEPASGFRTDSTHTSISVDAKLAALNAESVSTDRARALSGAANAAVGRVGDELAKAKASDQQQLDAVLHTIDELAGSSTFDGQKLLDGSLRLAAAGTSFTVPSMNTSRIGTTQIDGRTFHLTDVRSGGALSNDAASAGKVLDAAARDVNALQHALKSFETETLRPRQLEIAAQRAHLLVTAALLHEPDSVAENPYRPAVGGKLDVRA